MNREPDETLGMAETLILQVTEGPQYGERFAVPPTGAMLGRGTDCDIRLDDAECSRQHALVINQDDGYAIRDTGSTNGIYLNGKRVTNEQRLHDQDELRMGVTELRVELRTSAAGQAGATQVREAPQPSAELHRETDPGTGTVASDREDVPSAQFAKAVSDRPEANHRLTGILLLAVLLLILLGGTVWLLLPSDQPQESSLETPEELRELAAEEAARPVQQRAEVSGPDEAPIAETIGEELPEADPVSPPDPDLAVVPDQPTGNLDQVASEALNDDDDFLPEMALPPIPEQPAVAAPPTTPPAADPPAEPEVRGGEGDAYFLWLVTTPAGATVELGGEPRGTTPLLLENLPAGQHEVRFVRPHHEPLTTFCQVPNAGQQLAFELRQSAGTCRLTTDPAGAFVQRGPQQLGRTPLYLADLPPGLHPLQLVHPGYQTSSYEVEVDANRPTEAHVVLVPRTGSLSVVTIPGDVTITVNDLAKGTTIPAADGTGQSLPFVLEGFLPGRHQVQASWQGFTSPAITIDVPAGGTGNGRLIVYVPNLEVTLENDRTMQLMKVGETDDALLVISPKLTPVRLSKERVTASRPIPLAEARQLVQIETAPDERAEPAPNQ